MPARRRRSLVRNATTRLKMWEAKMDANVYARQLEATKPLAMPKVAYYQSVHEMLISMVKSILKDYPEEYSILQEYMWYTEKLWKLTQTYTSNALQKEANALFIWFLAKGRNEMALRKIALAMGLKIEDTDIIVEEMVMKIISKGTITTNGTEQTILEYVARGDIMTRISGYIDLKNMNEGDTVEIKAYVKLSPEADYELYHTQFFNGVQKEPAVYFLPRLSGYALKITLKQTQGSHKEFSYVFVRGG